MKSLYMALMVALLFAPVMGFTQQRLQKNPTITPLDDPEMQSTPTAVPFDGGITILLLAAGAGYAAKKNRDRCKKQLEGKTD